MQRSNWYVHIVSSGTLWDFVMVPPSSSIAEVSFLAMLLRIKQLAITVNEYMRP